MKAAVVRKPREVVVMGESECGSDEVIEDSGGENAGSRSRR